MNSCKRSRFPLVWLIIISLSYAEASTPTPPAETKMAVSYDKSRESLNNAFSSLETLDIGISVIAYNPRITKVVNKKRADLGRVHPLFLEEGLEVDDVLLLETKLSPDSGAFYILFSEGPSADPEFYFVQADSPNKYEYWHTLPGTALVVPGNGAVYVANRFNNTYTKRSKYIYSDTGLAEVKQPYHYVGLKTQTLQPITIYASRDETQEVARLPKGYDVEVLLTDGLSDKQHRTCFLVKTSFGLLGWTWVQESQYFSNTIEGISYWGD